MFQKINYGAKWCVSMLLTGVALVFLLVIVLAAAVYGGIALLNNWLVSQ